MERPVDPDLQDVLDAREEDLLLRLSTALPVRVQSHDAALQVADVVPLVRSPVPRADGTYTHEDLPVVPSVPVVWPRVGAWAMTMTLQPGDTGLLVCCQADVGTWRAGDGSPVDPVDLRRHHLSHGVLLPGLYRRGAPLARAATGDAGLVVGSDGSGARLTFKTDGSLEIAQGSTVVARIEANGTIHLGASSAASFVALADLVAARLETIRTAFNAHTHAVTGSSATGGAVAGTAAAVLSPIASLGAVAASKVKAT